MSNRRHPAKTLDLPLPGATLASRPVSWIGADASTIEGATSDRLNGRS